MTAADRAPRLLRHGKVDLALWALDGRAGADAQRPDSTHPLLLLHGLGERTPEALPPVVAAWPGPVLGLDFTGHGASTVPVGGGYTAELLMADVDTALAEIGPSTLLGRGLGAYVALLVAGARPAEVRGAVLADGPGLAGGGPAPGSPSICVPAEPGGTAPDPFALAELCNDVRPPDYAVTIVRQAFQLSGVDTPVVVSAVVRPPWLAAVADEPGVPSLPVPEALALFAR